MLMNHETFMRIALEEAQKGLEEGNVAVGSIIVCDGEVIARGRNLVSTTNDPTAHAETVALREAGTALGKSEFPRCTLYTTFEPCPMCCGAIMNSGISTPTRLDDFRVEGICHVDELRNIYENCIGRSPKKV